MSQHNIHWRINDLMAERKLCEIKDLHVKIEKTGYKISLSQTRRLVAETPERLSLDLLWALTQALQCEIGELLHRPRSTEEPAPIPEETTKSYRSPLAAVKPKLGRIE